MKRLFSLLLIPVMLSVFLTVGGISASAVGLTDHITVKSYDPSTDYMAAMKRALQDGSPYAMQVGAIYEQQRNLKITELKLSQEKTSYFIDFTSPGDILNAIELAERHYTSDDLDLLARIIYAEAGSSWIPDWVQRYVGSVVLNRVASSYYPNNIRDVVYQPGQYSPTWNGAIHKTPDARTVANARYLLLHGSICPANVVGQSNFISGSGIYQTYYDPILGTTTYFCYL